MSTKKAGQILTSFPNDNEKHIDYVILYKQFSDAELKSRKKQRIERMRQLFFEKLRRESFDIYYLNFLDVDNQNYVYALLNCSTERLLEEFSHLNYELQLKNVRPYHKF
jgi:hypothetical protein